MITEDQKKLYLVPCKEVRIISAVANSYDEAVKIILKEHPLVREYKTEDDNFVKWVKVND